MRYNNNFEKLLNLNTIKEQEYLGIGNPNSNILFIGKEAGAPIGSKLVHGSKMDWKNNGSYLTNSFIPNPEVESEKKLRNYNHTWQKYQSLYNLILQELSINQEFPKNYEINFVKDIFTTELSSLPAPKTIIAKQFHNFGEELKHRKNTFFKSDFIKQFQVVVIFASDNKYIETYKGEVAELFGVAFEKLHSHKGKSKIWINKGITIENRKKIVIHTRQLTYNFDKNLIPELAKIIAEFISHNDIKFIDEK